MGILCQHEAWIESIRKMNTGNLDLDQLLAFEAVLSQRSVSATARPLGRPQPTVNRWLGQLRVFFDDSLFFRTRRGVGPTPGALAGSAPGQANVQPIPRHILHRG